MIKLSTFKMGLFLLLIVVFAACNGQTNSKVMDLHLQQQLQGKMVKELPDKVWIVFNDHLDNFWFGSNGQGVYHYDGEQLRQFTKDDGLVSDYIRGIQEDHLGNIYLDTPDGISKFDHHTFTTLQAITQADDQWRLGKNDLWFKCNGIVNGAYRYDGESLFLLPFPKQDLIGKFGQDLEDGRYTPYGLYGTYKDRKGHLWFGTLSAGVFRYDGDAFLWFGEKELGPLEDGRVPGIRSILEDHEGNYWLSNFIHKYRINKSGTNSTYDILPGADIKNDDLDQGLPYFNSGIVLPNGDLWMTGYSNGIWKYNGKDLMNMSVEIEKTNALIISIYQDNQGLIWLGTDNLGVLKFDGERFLKFAP